MSPIPSMPEAVDLDALSPEDRAELLAACDEAMAERAAGLLIDADEVRRLLLEDEGDDLDADERARLDARLSDAIENPRVNGSALGFDEQGNRIRFTGFDGSGRPVLRHG